MMTNELDKSENVDYTSSDSNSDVVEADLEQQVRDAIHAELAHAETAEPVVETEVPEAETVEAVDSEKEEDPRREEAISKGWTPDGELSYKEFLGREPFFKRIKNLNRKTEKLETTILELKALLFEQNRAKYEQDRKYLESVRDTSDDASEVREATTRLQDLQQKEQALDKYRVEESDSPDVPQETIDFINKHKDWFSGTNALSESIKHYAISREQEIRQTNPDLDLEEVYEVLERDVMKVFPSDGSKTVKKKTTVAPPPTSPAKTSSSGKKSHPLLNKLDDFDRRMYNRLVKTKTIPESEFFKSIEHKYS